MRLPIFWYAIKMTTESDLTKSAFWVRKMQRIFQILDLNKDGVLSSEDWDMYVHYAMNQKQLKERQHVRFMKLFQRVKPLLLPDGSKTLRENFASCCVALVTQGTLVCMCSLFKHDHDHVTLFSSQACTAYLKT